MKTNQSITATLDALRQMTPGQLREKYAEVFGESTRSENKDFLFKRLAWRIQSLAEGSLSERAQKRPEELARDADLRTTLPRPPRDAGGGNTVVTAAPTASTSHGRLPIPGAILTRTYRGKRVEVKVLPQGFEYEGQT